MNRLHLFNPENDLALGIDAENYTPSPAVASFRRSGMTLPFWYGDEGDMVVTEGVDAAWLQDVRRRFGIAPIPFDRHTDGLTPTPWGWSKAARRRFKLLGFVSEALPTDRQLARMRELSHRRTAAELASRLAQLNIPSLAPAAKELTSADQIRAFINEHRQAIFKQPWSSSGRGIIPSDITIIDRQMPMLTGIISRQGSIMAEQRLDKTLDFALLCTMEEGKCSVSGYSVFTADSSGAYTGNVLLPQAALKRMIIDACPAESFQRIEAAIPDILSEIISTDYTGPLGIDMMAANDGKILAPAIEINLRRTMGHVAQTLQERYVDDTAKARYTIGAGSSDSGFDTADIRDGKMCSGRINLAPPGVDFSFVIECEK